MKTSLNKSSGRLLLSHVRNTNSRPRNEITVSDELLTFANIATIAGIETGE